MYDRQMYDIQMINDEKEETTLRVLEFYADKKNWSSPSKGFAAQYDPELSPVKTDHGDLAALAAKMIYERDGCEVCHISRLICRMLDIYDEESKNHEL